MGDKRNKWRRADGDQPHPLPRRARLGWDHTVAAHEAGGCGAVSVAVPILDEASRVAVVVGTLFRMVTSPDRRAYLERLIQARVVLRATDGLRRIDVATPDG